MTDALRITADLAIPRGELVTRATRAGGPGGQHVNTSSTRVELLWNVRESAVLDDAVRERLLARLATRIDASGTLRVVASATRSQRRNREEAEMRLAGMLRRALATPRKRIPTRPSRAAKEARLTAKRRRSDKKRERRKGEEDG